MLTPPESENEENAVKNNMRLRDKKKLGRKKLKKDRAKCYRDLKRKTIELNMWKRRADRYRKRLQRLNQDSTKDVPKIKNLTQALEASSNHSPYQRFKSTYS